MKRPDENFDNFTVSTFLEWRRRRGLYDNLYCEYIFRMMLTKKNMFKMKMIVLEYSEYSSAGKASNAIWAAIYNCN